MNGADLTEEREFVEFRRKVRSAEVLSAAMERLLWALRFTGRLSVVLQNGRVLKSGYEEGYFKQRAGAPAEGAFAAAKQDGPCVLAHQRVTLCPETTK